MVLKFCMVLACQPKSLFSLSYGLATAFEIAQEIMILMPSEGSGEPAHPRSLARAVAVPTHKVW